MQDHSVCAPQANDLLAIAHVSAKLRIGRITNLHASLQRRANSRQQNRILFRPLIYPLFIEQQRVSLIAYMSPEQIIRSTMTEGIRLLLRCHS